MATVQISQSIWVGEKIKLLVSLWDTDGEIEVYLRSGYRYPGLQQDAIERVLIASVDIVYEEKMIRVFWKGWTIHGGSGPVIYDSVYNGNYQKTC